MSHCFQYILKCPVCPICPVSLLTWCFDVMGVICPLCHVNLMNSVIKLYETLIFMNFWIKVIPKTTSYGPFQKFNRKGVHPWYKRIKNCQIPRRLIFFFLKLHETSLCLPILRGLHPKGVIISIWGLKRGRGSFSLGLFGSTFQT